MLYLFEYFKACNERSGFCTNVPICRDGEFVTGLCSGGALRRCCIPDSVQGDIYWNKLNDYNLTSRYGEAYGQGLRSQISYTVYNLCRIYGILYTSILFYSILICERSFVNATDYCSLATECAGISEEKGWFYTHSKAEVDGSTGVTSWMKGNYWANNFVPRVSWGASSPKAGVTGFMDPFKMIGTMGHHTDGNQCFAPSDCKKKMRDFQQDDFDQGLRYDQHQIWPMTYGLNTFEIFSSDMKFNFYIGDDGNIYEGRGINLIAAHW